MKVLVTVNITKGFDTWLAMSQSMTEEAAKNGIKMIWAATNPDETSVFVLTEMQDPAQMKTFGEREDIAKARVDAGAIVESTQIISPIGQMFMPD
ncbi:MAG: hypothetical protein CME00_06165 [Geminicoccus sp.]|nr:hypothetical protein [Geminicoccus sp.]HCI00350.1 hypothetical protein [Alphaproteobacteria bacterium]|tara:strand:- start:203 stop:487 length:285 start_codon:yes stop_codon:yes gene_type:complete